MILDELDLRSESFYTDEISALESVPRTEEGLQELLDYLDEMDSLPGYKVLFEDFINLLTTKKKDEMKKRFLRTFDVLSEDDFMRKYGC